MSATFAQARDDILAVLKAAWDPTGHPMAWPSVAFTGPPLPPSPWARASIAHNAGRQATLAGADGTRRWRRQGILTVQIFTGVGSGLAVSDSLSKIVVDAFEGATTPRQIWFRNVRLIEIGPDGDWHQVNVLVEFEYDEVK